MDLKNRISSFTELGTRLPALSRGNLFRDAFLANNWFTGSEVGRALGAWSELLTEQNLNEWTGKYPIPDHGHSKNVLVITAGNIPLVGFHDFLSVLISGNRFTGRLSSRDDILLSALARELISINPGFSDRIHLNDSPVNPHAVIATGSSNTARYFQREYGRFPHIIRKNRSSAAILDGTESPAVMESLAADILAYYGLGCRSISHLFLPPGYPPETIAGHLSSFNRIDPCLPLSNNHRYQRARLSVLSIPFIDAGRVLLVENQSLHSPIGVLHYSYYQDIKSLLQYLDTQQEEIQCITGNEAAGPSMIPFGRAQKPELWDYADHVDVMNFLINL
jgi:hypothetical protein